MSAGANSVAVNGLRRCRPAARYGVKGVDAARWLVSQGVAVPAAANRVQQWSEAGGGRCLRLGQSEFLVEFDAAGSGVPVPAAPTEAGAAAWVLVRSDCSVQLEPALWREVLPQLCAFDFDRLLHEPDLVVMTLVAGISVTLIRDAQATPAAEFPLRLWCDASFASYLQQCLQQLAISVPGESR